MSDPKFYSSVQADTNSYVGPGSASMLSFTRDTVGSFVKELTQNSLDACLNVDEKVFIRVDFKGLAKADVPDFDSLKEIIALNKKECERRSALDQYKVFFEHAEKSIESPLYALVFEDFNTCGLQGDDESGSFMACVNTEGVSKKARPNTRGKFGIGKNAAFTLSPINTALYSSIDKDGNVKFKGVTKLGNYTSSDGQYHSGRVYYGRKQNEVVNLIDSAHSIPIEFRRDKEKGSGLSQFILGVKRPDNWQEDFARAFIENYWFLLHKNLLEVEIGDLLLNKETYKDHALELFDKTKKSDEANPLPYIKCFENGETHTSDEIKHIGRMRLHLLEARENEAFASKIIMLRGGMKIFYEKLGVSIPGSLAGVMYCIDDKGNLTLGDMEPHTHDEFIPEILNHNQNSQGLSKEDGEEALKEIKNFRLKILREIQDRYSTAPKEISIVDELFSNIVNNVSKSGVGATSSTTKNTGVKKNRKIPKQKIVFSSDSKNFGVKSGDVKKGDGDGPGIGEGRGGTYPNKGKGSRKNGKREGGASQDTPALGKMSFLLFQKFVFSHQIENGNCYKLIVRVKENMEDLDLIIAQIGASFSKSNPMSSRLISVKQDGQKKSFKIHKKDKSGAILSYRILDLNPKQKEDLILELQFEENLKYSSFKLIDAL